MHENNNSFFTLTYIDKIKYWEELLCLVVVVGALEEMKVVGMY